MGIKDHKHSHLTPFNGTYFDKDGQLRNIDGSIGPDAQNNSNITPFNGVFLDSNGAPQNFMDFVGGSGGGGGGVTMAQVNAAVASEATIRQIADNLEITNRTNADTVLAGDISTETTNRISADAAEVTSRNAAISSAISTEITNRNTAINTAIATYDTRKLAVQLTTGSLTRVINGTTVLAKSLFSDIAQMVAGKCFINDANGTIGIYTSDASTSSINVRTLTIDTVTGSGGSVGSVLLGNVDDYPNLPLDVTSATTLFGQTPKIDDRVRVLVDSTHSGNLVEYYIVNIDSSDNITYGNEIVINTSNYQAQTVASDNGKVLIGGGTAGTFGTNRNIDTAVTPASTALIESGAVDNALAILRTLISTIDFTNLPTLLMGDSSLYSIAELYITTPGTGYAEGDILTLSTPAGVTFNITVEEIGTSGEITLVNYPFLSEATDFNTGAASISGTGGTGTGATFRVKTMYAAGDATVEGILSLVPDADPLVQYSLLVGYIRDMLNIYFPVKTPNIADGAVTADKIDNSAIYAGTGITVNKTSSGIEISSGGSGIGISVTFHNIDQNGDPI